MFRFQCSQCEAWHEELPRIGFAMPDNLRNIPAGLRDGRAWWSDDVCVIDNRQFYARARLEIPVSGSGEPFVWDMWVSLSEKSFYGYLGAVDRGRAGGPYFSWLANVLPGYPTPIGLKSQMRPQASGTKPMIVLERSRHPLSVDFHEGMPQQRAEALCEFAQHRAILPH